MTVHTVKGARIHIRDDDLMPWRDVVHEQPPSPSQGSNLRGLRRMLLGNLCQQADFSFHQPNVGLRLPAGIYHSRVDGQGLAGLDDAGVGFGGGHGGDHGR